MITGGNATVYISNMDAAISFYRDILGLKLSAHYGDSWATVEAGSFTIGLHPKSEKGMPPGTPGSISIGLNINEPVEAAAAKLKASGVQLAGDVQHGPGGNFIHFYDPDGNHLYLWEAPQS